ncbi:hypothetical protein SELMODRAFT_414166 [Selaginella moellendorffii]|uniref:DNA ligase n=1 Tax=Selaginella moellendorffii TaxID=88036 RepID=D8RRV7_SELML|nr:DNA ligase 4 [Selaginella moellendorffii]EFJ24951.1 hypothetical protein SELMODRAFT_414166 [Selaginella moellendorffii]|eukprot:XP_002973996.1 DNA ligase 4 [Selaginella moellendorffii]
MGENTVRFSAVSDMLERISKSKKLPVKRKTFRTFLDHFYTDREYFSVMRLVLPELDRERGNYGLKESVLAKCLADALGLAKGSSDADKLVNWRKGGSSVGKNAGNFALVAAEIVGSRQSHTSGGLTVKRVNELLDQLAEVKSREEKSKVLAEFINKTNPVEMKWLVMIILKDLKLGISEKTVFKEFHPDADEVYNKTCDLKLVCEKLVDPKVRFKRQDIEVGKAVRPQLASRVKNAEDAWKRMRGKRVIAECKFDGDRCQVHKDGNEVHFFSRSSIDHVEFAAAMSSVICENVKASKCILDGEMVVWNRVTNKFAEFGTIHAVAKNAKDGVQSDEQLCYIVFDILYLDDCSVIHQPLCERQKLLEQKVTTVPGRFELLQPDRRNCGGQLWSITPQSAADVEKFFLMTVDNREEGIVVKDFDSKWEPGDRSGKWMKLKPDYVKESEMDVLIIGGYYGSGRRGGDVAQFLLGIAERPASGYPTKFHSFCKVGTGLSDEECRVLVDKLRPYFRKYDKNTKPPSYYVVTNNAKERPDVWIEQPDKSVLLEVKSDIRKIKSEVFASPYSLRFPRVTRVRYDKPWNECLDIQELVRMVAEDTGAGVNGDGDGGRKKKQERSPKKKAPKLPLLAPHMQQTDVSGVKKVSDMLSGLVFFLVNFKLEDKERFHKLVAEYGGKFSMNLNGDVTHVLAESPKGLLYETATKRGDVIHSSWFMDSIAAKELLPLRPKYMLHLSYKTRETLKDTLDEFGDHYFVEVDEADMKQLFGRMRVEELSVNDKDVDEHRGSLGDRKNIFEGCSFYFYYPREAAVADEAMIAGVVLRRLEVEVELRKGAVKPSLARATHMIVFWDSERDHSEAGLSFSENKLVSSKKLRVLSHRWLEEALRRDSVPPEDDYDVRQALGSRLVEESPPRQEEPELSKENSEHEAGDEEQDEERVSVFDTLVLEEMDGLENEELPPKKKRHLQEMATPTLAKTLTLPTTSSSLDLWPTAQEAGANPTLVTSETLKLPSFEPQKLAACSETLKLPSLEPRKLAACSETLKLPETPPATVITETVKLPSFEPDKAFDNLLADFAFLPSITREAPAKGFAAPQQNKPRIVQEEVAKEDTAMKKSKASYKIEVPVEGFAGGFAAPQRNEPGTFQENGSSSREEIAMPMPAKKKNKTSLKDVVRNLL